MMTSDSHGKYFAHALTTRFSLEKLSESLLNATVNLKPQQVEAAVFAFLSPFGKGTILADEAGLGKTIEAGLALSQLWAERRRRILIIVHSLRNVYKKDSRIARELLEGLARYKRILLTASRLRNNSLELFGLSEFVDQQLFGDRPCISQLSRADNRRRIPLCPATWRPYSVDLSSNLKKTGLRVGSLLCTHRHHGWISHHMLTKLHLYELVSRVLQRLANFCVRGEQPHQITTVSLDRAS